VIKTFPELLVTSIEYYLGLVHDTAIKSIDLQGEVPQMALDWINDHPESHNHAIDQQ
jgi:hypothetical protein